MMVLAATGVTFASVTTDRWDYNFGETVQITGDEMEPGEDVQVDVTYPDGSLAQSHVVQSDDEGRFSDTFELVEGMPGGIYGVRAEGLTSGNVFTTEFDPPLYSQSVTPNPFPVEVDYSDVVTINGTASCAYSGTGPTCPTSWTTNTFLELKGGAFADWTTVASGSVTGNGVQANLAWVINWQAGKYSGGQVDPGAYNARVRLSPPSGGNQLFPDANGAGATAVTITKEDTVTTNGGPFSGDTNTTVNVSATVDDEDASQFANDAFFGGTVAFDLIDGSNVTVASVSDTTPTWNVGTGMWDFSAGLDLTGIAAGAYTLKATFTPSAASPAASTYYNGSSDEDDFDVLAPSSYTIEGFYEPVGGNQETTEGFKIKAKAGSTIPLKFNVLDGSDIQSDTGLVTKLIQKTSCATPTGYVDVLTSDELTTGQTSLRFDSDTMQMVFNYKTPKEKGCYLLKLKVDGGDSISVCIELF